MKTKFVMRWLSTFLLVILGWCFALPPGFCAPAGFFRVEKRDGVWWLIAPDGSGALSTGVDEIGYAPDRVRGTGPSHYGEAAERIYGDQNAWGAAALARLRSWGFNTIGAWSDRELWTRDAPYTVILNIAAHAGADWQHGKPLDVYDPRFEEAARKIVETECAPRAQDRNLIGYFSDNEMRWGPDWRGKETMLQMYLEFPQDAPGRRTAREFLRQHYNRDIGQLNRAWGASAKNFEEIPSSAGTDAFKSDADQFLGMMAARYFQVCARAIHGADPSHLYLGARFAGKVPDPVFQAARAADVVSVNIYSFDPRPLVEHIFKLTGKPILITEFAFRAEDSGLPNTRGAGPKVPDQWARAKAYADYVRRLESLPESIGYHWFKWADEPKEGRFDGENSNYGLVNINDEPYEIFVNAVKAANEAALDAHKKSVH